MRQQECLNRISGVFAWLWTKFSGFFPANGVLAAVTRVADLAQVGMGPRDTRMHEEGRDGEIFLGDVSTSPG